MRFPTSGIYAITKTEGKTSAEIIQAVEATLKGGAAVVQYRDKNPLDASGLGARLLQLCHSYRAPLLINDDLNLALELAADGVHLGKEDCDIVHARKLLGPKAIIGISCYNDVSKAIEMQDKGADYVAFGRFFPSGSKPLAAPAHIETLRIAKRALSIPIVAIGGILPENGGELLATGADLLAVIGGIFNNEPESAVRAYRALFNSGNLE